MTHNIYCNPEAFGLEIVDSLEFSSGAYEFDMLVVWKNAAGEFFMAEDSGCSCPIPFEDDNMQTLERVTPKQVRDHAKSRLKGLESWQTAYVTPEDIERLYRAMKEN